MLYGSYVQGSLCTLLVTSCVRVRVITRAQKRMHWRELPSFVRKHATHVWHDIRGNVHAFQTKCWEHRKTWQRFMKPRARSCDVIWISGRLLHWFGMELLRQNGQAEVGQAAGGLICHDAEEPREWNVFLFGSTGLDCPAHKIHSAIGLHSTAKLGDCPKLLQSTSGRCLCFASGIWNCALCSGCFL